MDMTERENDRSYYEEFKDILLSKQNWFRIIAITEIGGGLGGLWLALLFAPKSIAVEMPILFVLFCLPLLLGIVAGVQLLRQKRSGLILSIIVQSASIVRLISPILCWKYFLCLAVCYEYFNGESRVSFDFGGVMFANIFVGVPFGFSINFIALGFLIFLERHRAKTSPIVVKGNGSRISEAGTTTNPSQP